MSSEHLHPPDRRTFLASSGKGLGMGWLALNLPLLAFVQGCARDAARRGEPFRVLTEAQGATLTALADGILPPEGDFPGAGAAGAAHFVDRMVEGPLAELREPVEGGLEELDREAAASGPGAVGFSRLSAGGREAVLARFAETDLFGLFRFLVLASVFAEPRWGGNHAAGWDLVGLEHAPVHHPPFGFYDAQLATGEGDP